MKAILSDENEKRLVVLLLCLYLIAAIVWHFLTNAPLDDDCVTRYYNAMDALNNPSQFISLWNRPLFMLIFTLPFQISKHAVLLMALFSAIGAYALYKSAKKLELNYAYLVIPFLLFQTIYFNISKSALAEPMAAVIIALGLLFYLDKKFLYFAIIGAFLPLARLELSVLLLFWVYILVKNKRWSYVFILGIPIVLWNLAGTIIEGDIFWLFSALKNSNPEENPYGHTGFWHYFQRYIYVLGPIIFYFFFIGFFERLLKRKIDVFLMIQFIAAFFLYVMFSWKLNLGKAIGFLRNITPLATLAAIIALYGFNYWMDSITNTHKSQDKSEKSSDTDLRSNRISIIILSVVCTVITILFFSQKLEMHHEISDLKDFKNLIVILSLTLTYIFLVFIWKYIINIPQTKHVMVFLLISGVIGYTLITEPPDVHNTPERETMSEISDIYVKSPLANYPTYVNHIWFFWPNDIERNSNFNIISKENLDNAPSLSVVIFENHYNQIQGRGIDIEYLEKNSDFVELFRLISSDKTFYCSILLKTTKNNPKEVVKIYNKLIEDNCKIPSLFYNRGKFFNKYGKIELAYNDYSKTIEMDSSFYEAYFRRGIIYYTNNEFDKAISDFNKSIAIYPKYHEAYCNVGVCYASINNSSKAIENLSKAIQLRPDFFEAYYYRAIVYSDLSKFKEAINDYSQIIKLQPYNADLYINRAKAYFEINNKSESRNDLKKAISINKNVSIPKELKQYCN